MLFIFGAKSTKKKETHKKVICREKSKVNSPSHSSLTFHWIKSHLKNTISSFAHRWRSIRRPKKTTEDERKIQEMKKKKIIKRFVFFARISKSSSAIYEKTLVQHQILLSVDKARVDCEEPLPHEMLTLEVLSFDENFYDGNFLKDFSNELFSNSNFFR